MLTIKHRKAIQKAFTPSSILILQKKSGWNYNLIQHYKNATKIVSPERAIIIESLTGISVEILRPDIFKRNGRKP